LANQGELNTFGQSRNRLSGLSHTMLFTEAQLVSFGNFLLKTYGVQVYSTDGKNQPIYQREVTDADFSNWKEVENPNPFQLPSGHQIDAPVWLALWSCRIPCEVHAVHFYDGKVKYDLRVFGEDGQQTRVYNIDSAFVTKK